MIATQPHRKYLEDRLGDAKVDPRNFQFLTPKETVAAFPDQGVPFVPSIEFFYRDLDGKPLRSRYRLLFNGDGKFRQPKDTGVHAYLPLLPGKKTWKRVAADVSEDLIITEGEVKTLAAIAHLGMPTVGLGGVDQWHIPKTREPLPELKKFKWRDRAKQRRVWVMFDSNMDHNRNVRRNAVELGDALAALGADPWIVKITDLNGSGNTGLDDFLVHPAGGFQNFQLLPRYRLDSKTVANWRAEIGGIDAEVRIELAEHCRSAADIVLDKTLITKWIVNGLLAEDKLVILSGSPKVGKTTFMVRLLLHACGALGPLGDFSAISEAKNFPIGYFNEMGETGIKRSIKALCPKVSDKDIAAAVRNLIIYDKFDTLDATGLQKLDDAIVKNKFRIFVIDTLGAVRPSMPGTDAQSADAKIMRKIGDIGRHRHCAIVVMTQGNKRGGDLENPLDRIAHTNQFSAAADDIWMLYRKVGDTNRQRYFQCIGRNVMESDELVITLDGANGLGIVGKAIDIETTDAQKQILDCLTKAAPLALTPSQIATLIGKTRRAVANTIARNLGGFVVQVGKEGKVTTVPNAMKNFRATS